VYQRGNLGIVEVSTAHLYLFMSASRSGVYKSSKTRRRALQVDAVSFQPIAIMSIARCNYANDSSTKMKRYVARGPS